MKVTKLNDSAGITGRDTFTVNKGESITDILIKEIPGGIDADSTTVTLNGRKLELPKFSDDGLILKVGDEHLLTRELREDDHVGIIHETKGADPITIALAVFSLITTVYAYTSIPDIPPQESDAQETENNRLYGQRNSAKLYSAIPDIYGFQTSYPDLITSEPFKIYNNDTNETEISQFMCIGIGSYEFQSEPRLGGTTLTQIPGATSKTYEPSSDVLKRTVVDDFKAMFSVDQIEGQELKGPVGDDYVLMEGGEIGVAQFSGDPNNLNIDDAIFFIRGNPSQDFSMYFSVGDKMVLSNVYRVGDNGNYYFDGVIELTSVSQDRIDFKVVDVVDYDAYVIIYILIAATPGNPEIDLVGEGRFSTFQYNPIGFYDTTSPGHGIKLDIIYPRGFKESIARYEIEYQEIQSPGGGAIGSPTVVTVNDEPTGVPGMNEQVRTLSYDITGPNGDASFDLKYYRVKITRMDVVSSDPGSPNISKYESLKSFMDYTGQDIVFDNLTIIKVEVPGTYQAVSPRKNKFNIDVIRKTINLTTSTLQPSKKFSDAVIHEFTEVFGQDVNLLDTDELIDIELSMVTSDIGEFCHTFQDSDMGLEQRIQTICNVARVQVYRDGKKWRFVREEAKDFISGIITSRDIASSRNYSKTWRSRLPTEFDGVRVEYTDPELNKKAYVYKTISSTGQVLDQRGRNNKIIPLTGCRNFAQANDRANVEIRRLIFDNFTINDTLLSQGNLYDIGDIVKYADTFQKDVLGGEIKAIGGTSQAVLSESTNRLDPNKSYRLTYNDEFGEIHGPFLMEFGEDPFTVILSSGSLSEAYVADYANTQLGSRFVISEDVEGKERLYVIKEKIPNGSGDTVDVTLLEYNEKMYSEDLP